MKPTPVFESTNNYLVSDDLKDVVNVAIAIRRPILIKGEPGTGKTMLAKAIADSLGLPLITWNIKSTTKAQEGLYVYDTVQRLYDSQFGDHDVSDIKQFIKLGKLGEAFLSEEKTVLLIDEIDKADLEFPNDLLWELDIMNFYIPEIKETIAAKQRPVVVITSNAEKELPDAFLRRCVFHYISFPDEEMMERIIRVHFPNLENKLLQESLKAFYWVRSISSLQKKPSTSELLDWTLALISGGIRSEKICAEMPFLGVLLKKNKDYDQVLQKLASSGKQKPAAATGYGQKNW
ncbi:ATP-binding protein [Peptococcaceae bacterium SCADC1_2_3]|jgi:MoxR-like ATPase|nr:ATP-binding protein [Peptococcaceae bacterium SCADC1_2_3]KFI37149.1 ATP-binding protein [Peptococcaceae bacterium SCADC1_2_3]KFI37462.1 ATP-binding protein [Peptococcaceae bacterium SCADC1_2_3]HCJ79341.1 MoxR family ATPase [Desulfotomaculum sp.]